MNKWFAIGGVKRSGKDTFAKNFEECGFVKINFADNLKKLCSSAFSISLDIFYSDEYKEKELTSPIVIEDKHIVIINEWIHSTHDFTIDAELHKGRLLKTPREIMQYTGTEIIRHAYPDYHVEATLANMADHKKVVCSDVRFPNELSGMRDKATELGYGFFSFYIHRNGFVGDSHASEAMTQEDFDLLIENETILGLSKMASLFVEKD